MPARMSAAQEKMPPPPPPPFSFAPFEKAVMESIAEGIVLFDSFGRLLYANQSARRLVEAGARFIEVTTEYVPLRMYLTEMGALRAKSNHGFAFIGE